MDRTERFYKIDQLLHERGTVPVQTFLETLEVSLATFKRDLDYMRSRLNAPILWDRDANGYRYDTPDPLSPQYALPGLWFNASEIYALLTMQHLLSSLQPGLLAPHIAPLLARLKNLLESEEYPSEEIERRIQVLRMASRTVAPAHFEIIAAALLKRRRLQVTYYARSRDEESVRELSPQRLTHYRDNWYLDAWCHLRQGVRSFSMDAIRSARMLDAAAVDVAADELDATLGSGYGIFSGSEVSWAKLRFSPEQARWVAHEQWHPQQKQQFDAEGFYLLEIPYADDRELVMDILKYGPEVEVLAPAALRERVKAQLIETLGRYSG